MTDHQDKIQPPLPVSLSPSPSGPAHSFLDTPQPGELPAVHRLIQHPLCTSCSLSPELSSLPSPLGLKTQLSITPAKPPRPPQAECDAPSRGFRGIFSLRLMHCKGLFRSHTEQRGRQSTARGPTLAHLVFSERSTTGKNFIFLNF